MLHFLLQKKLPFAIWSLPGSQKWQGIAQNDSEVEKLDLKGIYTANGFIVAPFKSKDKVNLIRPDIEFNSDNFSLEIEIEELETKPILTSPSEIPFIIEKAAYLESCSQLISTMKRGEAKKIVLSRVMAVSFDPDKLIRFYNALVEEHKNAMVFVYSTGDGIWIGASPEVFMETKNNRFKTVALAGSKPATDHSAWGQKEVDEQDYVTQYIKQKLRETGVVFDQSDLTTVSAGPVAHLQTEFTGKIDRDQLPIMIKKTHPTPAVCGIPKGNAMDLILEIEKHNRGDYTGFLGPVNRDDLQLFVNLRSALVTQNLLYLFIGGGITADSVPEKEWEETGLKAKTLIDCYKNC